MADYLEKLKKEYPGMFGPVGSAPAVASHEFATEWYRPGSDERWARRGEWGSADLLDIDPKTDIGILYPKGSEAELKRSLEGPMPVIEPTLDPETPAIKRPKPYDPLTDPELLRMMGEEPMYEASLDSFGLDPATVAAIEAAAGAWPEFASLGDAGLGWPRIRHDASSPSSIYPDSVIGGRSETDPITGETLIWSMDKGRMVGPRGGAYELEFARKAEEDAALVEKAAIEADAWYASPEYAHEEKLRESERKRPPKLTYWTKKDPWSVDASRKKYPDWHPLDTMPAWYTKFYPDPDAAAKDALSVPDMKIWGIGPGVKDPLSDSVGGLSFKSPDLRRTFSSDDKEFLDESGKHTGGFPETPAMWAASYTPRYWDSLPEIGSIGEDGKPIPHIWHTPPWLSPRSAELGGGPRSLYEGEISPALTTEILKDWKAKDPRTRIGPMVERPEPKYEGEEPDPIYHPTAYPDLAWYTDWTDAERIAGYPASWDYTDVIKDKMLDTAELYTPDEIFDPAAPWAGDVTEVDRLVKTFATDYRGEDPREYLEERSDPEYYPLPKYVSGMHGSITGGDDKDWYTKVMRDWYGGIESDPSKVDRGYSLPMSRTSPEMKELLEEFRTPAAGEAEPLDYDFGFLDYFDPSIVLGADTSRSSSTEKSRAIAKSWAEDYPFIDAAGGFKRPELRDRAAAAYGYGPGPAEGMAKGWAATKAEEAFARPIAAGAAGIKGGMTKELRDFWERGIPMSSSMGSTFTSRHLPGVADSSRLDDLVSPLFDPDRPLVELLGGSGLPIAIPTFGDPDKDVSDLMSSAAGASFADYIRKASPSVDPTYSIPDSAITKLWAEDIVRPAFSSLADSPMSKGFVSAPIDYTYLGSGTPWLTPSGEAPTLSFAVGGLYE